MKKILVILEMANNHMGDTNHAIDMINEFRRVCNKYTDYFDFAIKFQFRNLNTYIDSSFIDDMNNKYVKRFTETRLSDDQFKMLKDVARKNNFITICTAFDEDSVDKIDSMGFDYIKIASCSMTDWPLLNKIVEYDIPIIFSTAGSSLTDIDNVVAFFDNRGKSFSLMHCVGEYPTKNSNLQLNQIDLLSNRYPTKVIGYSTHEDPENYEAIKLAIAKNVGIVEKHIALKTEKYQPNAYSVTPEQFEKWMDAAKLSLEICGNKEVRLDPSEKEMVDLLQFKRAAYAARDISVGENLNRDDFYFAWPNISGQILANDCSKYMNFIAKDSIKKGNAILSSCIDKIPVRDSVWNIVQTVKDFILQSKVRICNDAILEISHHYGIDKFYDYGLSMITEVNREYCKKIMILLPNQKHPEQYHEKKEETFIVSYGSIQLYLDGNEFTLNAGDVKTIERGTKHWFTTKTGAIIEEISSTHHGSDSYYTDESIHSNKNRKTYVRFWL